MKRIVILPLDGYPTGQALLEAMDKMFKIPGIEELVAYIKINDGVHNEDIGGPAIVKEIQTRLIEKKLPIGIFLDLKIYDVSATMENVLKKYAKNPPDILTVSSGCSVDGIIKLSKLLPKTKLAMVSLLTDISKEECNYRFRVNPEEKIYTDIMVIRSFDLPKRAGTYFFEPFDFIVCSPFELPLLNQRLSASFDFIVPGIRDEWMKKKDEHQKRTTGVKRAIELGANLIVMGAQLTKGNPEMGITPEESCRLTIEQIEKADL